MLASSAAVKSILPDSYTKLPPHQMGLANPYGSSYMSKSLIVAPAPVSEYTDRYVPPWHSSARNGSASKQSGLAMSQQLHNDALSTEIERSSGKLLPVREKTLYPINDIEHIKHR